MDFCKRLYSETKEYHKQVDNHLFIELVRNDIKAGDIYIEFNKKCISVTQQYLCINKLLQNKLHREIQTFNNLTFNEIQLIKKCKEFPLEHEYLFKLGILSGGNLLKKTKGISETHYDFLTFDNSKQLVNEFKEYINYNVINKNDFIENVKNSYKLIKIIFDEYLLNYN